MSPADLSQRPRCPPALDREHRDRGLRASAVIIGKVLHTNGRGERGIPNAILMAIGPHSGIQGPSLNEDLLTTGAPDN